MADIDNVRTLEDLISVVRKLYFNMDKISENYYNMFWNPEPMTLEMERYDETGKLVTVSLKNRAAELSPILKDYGDPNGLQEGNQGDLYLDLGTKVLYYKGEGNGDKFGWNKVYSDENLKTEDFLSPDGSGALLKNLNASSVNNGVLGAQYGGTGVGTSGQFEGIVKANWTDPYSQAVPGSDYINPDNLVGMIAYFSKNDVRDNWLLCNGGTFSSTTYPKLYEYLGNSNLLPDLRDYFIRSWDGTSTGSDSKIINSTHSDTFKSHNHTLSGSATTSGAGGHSHTRGNMNITGTFKNGGGSLMMTGAIVGRGTWTTSGVVGRVDGGNDANYTNEDASLDASKSWTGNTSEQPDHTHTVSNSGFSIQSSGDTETAPKHIILVPMIYAGRKVVS